MRKKKKKKKKHQRHPWYEGGNLRTKTSKDAVKMVFTNMYKLLQYIMIIYCREVIQENISCLKCVCSLFPLKLYQLHLLLLYRFSGGILPGNWSTW